MIEILFFGYLLKNNITVQWSHCVYKRIKVDLASESFKKDIINIFLIF